MPKKASYVTEALFEERYLATLGVLVHTPVTALTEIVTKAWDAGAIQVNIFISEDYDQKLVCRRYEYRSINGKV